MTGRGFPPGGWCEWESGKMKWQRNSFFLLGGEQSERYRVMYEQIYGRSL